MRWILENRGSRYVQAGERLLIACLGEVERSVLEHSREEGLRTFVAGGVEDLVRRALLDDAAAMIDERRLPEGLVPDDGAMPPAAAPRETGGPEPMELPQ